MNIPNKVKIGAHEYDIVFRDDMDDENFGTCRPTKTKIFIDETVANSQKEETFFHEVLHAIRHQIGQEEKDKDDEEKIVQALAHSWYLFLKENKII